MTTGSTWRLLISPPQPGALNMAMDEAIAEAVAEGQAPPTLRFYRWLPACLSLGYFQSFQETVDRDGCRRWDVDCVRRPTGGRAVLHDDELTYSVCAAESLALVSGDVTESYRKISAGVLAGLRLLGIQAEQAPGRPGQGRAISAASAVCFHVPSDYELVVRGRKIVGSAQMRTRGVVLQHGSFPLSLDVAKLFDVLRLSADEERAVRAEELRRRVTSASEARGTSVSFEEAAGALAEGFRRALGIELVAGQLSSAEAVAAERWRAEKYDTPEWSLSH